MVEYESIDASKNEVEEIEQGESKEAECIGPNKGECLMIRKALSIGSTAPQSDQREAIFHTR